MKRTMEWHVRKIRETETGGDTTSIDSPILLEMNHARTSFRTRSGQLLFPPLGTNLEKEELPGHIEINGDYQTSF